MLVSFEKRFAFIHIPKTAGLSIHRALKSAAPDAIRNLPGLDACRDPLKNRHLFASDLRDYFGETNWNVYFTFAFVRNPYSRLVSWYNMCIERPTTPFMRLIKREARTFDDFLNVTHWRAARTLFNQVDYITDQSGKVIVDFVGRYENVDADFKHVCKKIGIRVDLPHINRTTPVDYRTYYNHQTRKLVVDRFRRDFEMFAYTFE